MSDIFSQLSMYFQFSFVRYAFVVGILIALCSSLLGIPLVLKRLSFIGTGLSNVAFGSAAVAASLALTNNLVLILPVTIATSILLMRINQKSKVNSDASLAMISAGALAIGYLVFSVWSSSANLAGDICTVLFGSTSILTLSMTDVWISIVLSIIVIGIFIVFYHKIFSITFDRDFTVATGIRVGLYNIMLSVVIAVVIVLAMTLVGSLLTAALIVFPVMTAVQLFKSFKSVTICTVILAVVCTAIGMLASILLGTPVGSTIIVADIIMFVIFFTLRLILKRG